MARSLQHTEIYGLRTDLSGKTKGGGNVLTGVGDADAPPSELEGDAGLRDLGHPQDSDAAAAAANKGSDRADAMRRTLNDQFMPQGVAISDVIITDVQLPDVIVQQMAEKTTVIAQNAAQKMCVPRGRPTRAARAWPRPTRAPGTDGAVATARVGGG